LITVLFLSRTLKIHNKDRFSIIPKAGYLSIFLKITFKKIFHKFHFGISLATIEEQKYFSLSF